MKVNFKALAVTIQGEKIYALGKFKIQNGVQVEVPDSERGDPLALGFFVIDALMAQEENMTGDEKVTRYKLALKLQAPAKETEISAEELVLIRKATGKFCSTVVLGQIWEALDKAEGAGAEARK